MSSTPLASATIPRLGQFPPRTPDALVACPCGLTHTVTHADRVDDYGQPVSSAPFVIGGAPANVEWRLVGIVRPGRTVPANDRTEVA